MEIKLLAPLSWPTGTPKNGLPFPNPFRRKSGPWTFHAALSELKLELSRLGATGALLSMNVKLRNDGLPYAKELEKASTDPSVALYYELEGEPFCIPCDKWDSLAANLRAIVLHIEALRGLERWGCGRSRQAFDGFRALPPAEEASPRRRAARRWEEVFDLPSSAPTAVVRSRRKALVLEFHPDRPGGSEERLREINLAFDSFVAERGLEV